MELRRPMSHPARRVEEEPVARRIGFDGLDVHDRCVGAGADLFGPEGAGVVLVVVGGIKIECWASVARRHREGDCPRLGSDHGIRPRGQASDQEIGEFRCGGHASVARRSSQRLLVGVNSRDEAVGVVGDDKVVVERHDPIAGNGERHHVVVPIPEGARRGGVRDLPGPRIKELHQVSRRVDGQDDRLVLPGADHGSIWIGEHGRPAQAALLAGRGCLPPAHPRGGLLRPARARLFAIARHDDAVNGRERLRPLPRSQGLGARRLVDDDASDDELIREGYEVGAPEGLGKRARRAPQLARLRGRDVEGRDRGPVGSIAGVLEEGVQGGALNGRDRAGAVLCGREGDSPRRLDARGPGGGDRSRARGGPRVADGRGGGE